MQIIQQYQQKPVWDLSVSLSCCYSHIHLLRQPRHGFLEIWECRCKMHFLNISTSFYLKPEFVYLYLALTCICIWEKYIITRQNKTVLVTGTNKADWQGEQARQIDLPRDNIFGAVVFDRWHFYRQAFRPTRHLTDSIRTNSLCRTNQFDRL